MQRFLSPHGFQAGGSFMEGHPNALQSAYSLLWGSAATIEAFTSALLLSPPKKSFIWRRPFALYLSLRMRIHTKHNLAQPPIR